MTELWTVGDIGRAVSGELSKSGSEAMAVSSLSIDTRTLEPGALYIAIKGVSQDGHNFVPQAFKAGAVAALVSRSYQGASDDGLLIRVDDTLAALEALGRAARARARLAHVIAVTGSAGKTGTKAALEHMFGAQGITHASVKSFNNHWGVPLSLARMPRDTEFGVFEVGMNHAGEITPLSKLIRPDAVLITTVAPVHIGHFANEEEIADAKAEIFAGLSEGGAALLPADNKHFERLKTRAVSAGVSRIYSFGDNEKADARLLRGTFGPDGSQVEVDIFGHHINFETAIPGAHIAMNLIAALGLVFLVNGDPELAARAISEVEAPEGRGQRHQVSVPGGSLLLIDESYNANPASMKVALLNLSQYQGAAHRRRVAVVGDMLELGALSKDYHEELAGTLNQLPVDCVFAAGEMMGHMFEKLDETKQSGYAATSEGLVDRVEKYLRAGDVVMVKGSLGSDMGCIVRRLQGEGV